MTRQSDPSIIGIKGRDPLESCHAVDVLKAAFAKHGTPTIVNIDQGSQFIAEEFVQAVKIQGCKISMDGCGALRDNVIVERFWKSLQYERVYLFAYDSVFEVRKSILGYMVGTTNPGRILAWRGKPQKRLAKHYCR